jgi:hypothetical protein
MKGTPAVSVYISFETCHTIMVGDVQVLDTFLDACQNLGAVPDLNIYYAVIMTRRGTTAQAVN